MILALALLCGATDEVSFTHESFDGFKIDAKLAIPKETPVSRVVLLVGGSGPYDMDLDLAAASKDKTKPNLWLKDVSNALVARGFAVIRYHKRPYQLGLLRQSLKKEKRKPTEEELALGKRFLENPLKYFVDDCKSFAEYSRKRFPEAKVYLLGASEGTHVALWAAHELGWISGVALIGFYTMPLDTIMFEQCVYRDLNHFDVSDTDHDGFLTREELKAGVLGPNLLPQFAVFDFDKDGKLHREEYKAYTFTVFTQLGDLTAYRLQEAKYPPMLDVLKSTKVRVAFFQGLWDNQTPAYNTRAVEVLAQHVWKKSFRFRYFPKLGHCLDPRDSYHDLYYSPVDPQALRALGKELDGYFPRSPQ